MVESAVLVQYQFPTIKPNIAPMVRQFIFFILEKNLFAAILSYPDDKFQNPSMSHYLCTGLLNHVKNHDLFTPIWTFPKKIFHIFSIRFFLKNKNNNNKNWYILACYHEKAFFTSKIDKKLILSLLIHIYYHLIPNVGEL